MKAMSNRARAHTASAAAFALELYVIFTIYILPANIKSLSLIILAISVLCLGGKTIAESIRINRAAVIVALGMLIAILIGICAYGYPIVGMISMSISLVLVVAISSLLEKKTHIRWFKLFCVTCTIVIAVSAVIGIRGGRNAFTLSNYDKNYFSVIVFLLFTLNWKKKLIACWATCLVVLLQLDSRLGLVMLLLFLAIEVISGISPKLAPTSTRSISSGVLAVIFVLMLVGIILFSYIWVNCVIGANTSSYQESLNDVSNAARFSSNVYAAELIAENPLFLLRGYDESILSSLNVISWETGEGTMVGRFGLVQPHHVILNMIVREGIIYTVLYFGVLATCLSKWLTKANASIWIAYFVGCMIMHSLLSGYFLINFFFVLVATNNGEGLGSERR